MRLIAYVLYYVVASRLPWSIRPFGGFGRRARAWCCNRLFDSAGADINVENSVQFGSGRGVRIGDRSGIGSHGLVMGAVNIGSDVMIGPRCVILSQNHNFARADVPMNRQGLSVELPVVIEDDVWIGAMVVLLPGRRIGTGAIVAAGAVVTRDVSPFQIVGGNPARPISNRQDPERAIP